MKICVIGAGAIGGLVGMRFAQAGEDVTLVDVGAHLSAIQANGLRLISPEGNEEVLQEVRAVGDTAKVGPQDLIVLALKANVLPAMVDKLTPLYGPDTMILPVQNGLPWWYFQRHGGPYEGRVLETVDPKGVLASKIDPKRIIGCVVYPAGEVTEPGVIKHVEGNRFPVGELDGSQSDRVQQVSDVFNRSGFKSFVLDDIRSEIWLKLWGNLSFNPISALTQATLEDICRDPHTRDLAASMMREAQDIAEKLGITFRVPLEKRIEGAEKVGRHKTSMLQDVEAGRRLEIDAIIAAVAELGVLTSTPTPHIDTVLALIKLLDRVMDTEMAQLMLQKIA